MCGKRGRAQKQSEQDVDGRHEPGYDGIELVPLQPVFQRFAEQQRHGDVGDAAVLADLENGNDVVVMEGRRRPAFAQESAAGRGGSARSSSPR